MIQWLLVRWRSSDSWAGLVAERSRAVYVSRLDGSSHGGMGNLSGVTWDCSTTKCEWRVSSIVWGLAVISLFCGTLMVARLGWPLALGYSPAALLSLSWYSCGIFLYRTSSFFLMDSMMLFV